MSRFGNIARLIPLITLLAGASFAQTSTWSLDYRFRPGDRMAFVPDVNADGVTDLIVGNRHAAKGEVHLVSGRDFKPIRTWQGLANGSGFGSCLVVGDINGDKVVDYLVGAPSENGGARECVGDRRQDEQLPLDDSGYVRRTRVSARRCASRTATPSSRMASRTCGSVHPCTIRPRTAMRACSSSTIFSVRSRFASAVGKAALCWKAMDGASSTSAISTESQAKRSPSTRSVTTRVSAAAAAASRA